MIDFLDVNKKTLLEILSAVIRNKKANLSCDGNIDWTVVANEADRHKVTSLLYHSIVQNAEIHIPDDIKEELRIKFLFEITEQESNYLAFGEILRKLAESNVTVVILKGLFLRDLYHEPLLRSMNDYDVLIKSEDFKKVTAIMKETGYEKVNREDKHTEYSHPYFMMIEFHKSLVSADLFENSYMFEEKVWKGVIPFKVCGADVMTLELTDHAIHLVLHMASHIKSAGFGLRQLCDWVIFIETYSREIDWDIFNRYISSMGVAVFTQVLFVACHKLFDLKIPQELSYENKSIQEAADKLIVDVFDSGVFGNDDKNRKTANRILYYTGGSEAKTLMQRMRILLVLLFPKAENLDNRFRYAKKYRILLPIAWMHRFLHTIIRRDIKFSDKTAVFRPKKAIEICTERSLLMQQLGLLKK
jgi:hypothetical protein